MFLKGLYGKKRCGAFYLLAFINKTEIKIEEEFLGQL